MKTRSGEFYQVVEPPNGHSIYRKLKGGFMVMLNKSITFIGAALISTAFVVGEH